MENKDVWNPDGFGTRVVDGIEVLANGFVSPDGGRVAWHARIISRDDIKELIQYWVEGDTFREFLSMRILELNDSDNAFGIGDIVEPDQRTKAAVLRALSQLDEGRNSRNRLR